MVDQLLVLTRSASRRSAEKKLKMAPGRLTQLAAKGQITDAMAAKVLVSAVGAHIKSRRVKVIESICQFQRISSKTDSPAFFNERRNAELAEQLADNHGIYAYYDSSGSILYVGRATEQSLLNRMKQSFNHPKRVEIISRTKKYGKVDIHREKKSLRGIARYFSAWFVKDELIKQIEEFLIRIAPNELHNVAIPRAYFRAEN